MPVLHVSCMLTWFRFLTESPSFLVKLAVRMSVEGLMGVLSLSKPFIYAKRLKSSTHYRNSVTEFSREQMNQSTCVFLNITNSKDFKRQLFFFSPRKEHIFLPVLVTKKHEGVRDLKVTPEGKTSSSEGWNTRQHPGKYPGFRKTLAGSCHQHNKEP